MEKQINKKVITEESVAPEARAERLKRLRNLANLSRKEMCDLADIKPDTLIGWEVARHGGLTENGANKIIACIAKEGVQCTLEWLLYDIGSSPTVLPNFDRVKANLQNEVKTLPVKNNEEKLIIEELLLFRAHYRNAFDYIVEDDSMSPQYQLGDYVAGVKRYKKNISLVTEQDCIVQLTDGKILLRSLRQGSKPNLYTLLCTNLKTTTSTPVIYDVEIICAAPVVWIRRKDLHV